MFLASSKLFFIISNLHLNIQVVNESLILIPGLSNISLYIFRNFYIQYFNYVTISGLSISPSVDYNFKYPNS